jgi:hypothetical protein
VHQHKLGSFAARDLAPCEATGRWIAFSDAPVDHADPWPFVRIVGGFRKLWPAPAIADLDGVRRVFGRARDAQVDVLARLRVVHRKVNLGKRRGIDPGQ